MRARCSAANNYENLQSIIIALDGPRSDGCKRDTVPDMPGDNRVHQYLRVVGQTAKPRRQIDDVSDR